MAEIDISDALRRVRKNCSGTSRASIEGRAVLAHIEQQAAEITRLTEALNRWEAYREEIADKEQRLGGLAGNFLELGAWEDVAKCALKAEGMKWVRGRMPPGANHE